MFRLPEIAVEKRRLCPENVLPDCRLANLKSVRSGRSSMRSRIICASQGSPNTGETAFNRWSRGNSVMDPKRNHAGRDLTLDRPAPMAGTRPSIYLECADAARVADEAFAQMLDFDRSASAHQHLSRGCQPPLTHTDAFRDAPAHDSRQLRFCRF
jgi:hypothetical protein